MLPGDREVRTRHLRCSYLNTRQHITPMNFLLKEILRPLSRFRCIPIVGMWKKTIFHVCVSQMNRPSFRSLIQDRLPVIGVPAKSHITRELTVITRRHCAPSMAFYGMAESG